MHRDWVYNALIVSFLAMTFALVSLVFFPGVVFAEAATPEPVPDLGGFWAAVQSQHWPLVIGIGLTLIVWAFRNFIVKKIPKDALPWVTLGLALVSTSGTRIVQACEGGGVWWQAAIEGALEGLTIGFAAIGFWDTKQTVRRRKVG